MFLISTYTSNLKVMDSEVLENHISPDHASGSGSGSLLFVTYTNTVSSRKSSRMQGRKIQHYISARGDVHNSVRTPEGWVMRLRSLAQHRDELLTSNPAEIKSRAN